jgi:phage/plasmid-associated DNA primase
MSDQKSWTNYFVHSTNTHLYSGHILSTDLPFKLQNFSEHIPLYHCVYELEPRNTFTNYEGLLRPTLGLVFLDFDHDDPEVSLGEVRTFSKLLSLENIPHSVFFSGRKGFHVTLPAASCLTQDEVNRGCLKVILEHKMKSLAIGLKAQFPTVDNRVWNANRKFRGWNSINEKTGLFKIKVNVSDSIEEIKEQAKKPQIISDELLAAWLNLESVPLSPWLSSLCSHSPSDSSTSGQGDVSETDSIFYTHTDKKCLSELLSLKRDELKGFNRHDVRLRLICDMRDSGVSEVDALRNINTWAEQVFGTDELDRIKETRFQIKALYKSGAYSFNCNDDIKQAFCDAKCTLYEICDPKQRAQNPKNLGKKYASQNQKAKHRKDSGGRLDALFDEHGAPIQDNFIKRLMSELDKPIIKTQEKDTYEWQSTHWESLTPVWFENRFYSFCWGLLRDAATDPIASQIINAFRKLLPVASEPHNLYGCHETKINFNNGTLNITKGDDGKFLLTLQPHDKQDLMSDYKNINFGADNPHLGEVPEDHIYSFKRFMKVREQDMGAEGIRMLKQALATALVPITSRLFFFDGASGSGKSTMLQLVLNLVGKKNAVMFDPCDHSRFAMEHLPGKRLCYNPDLKVKQGAALRDEVLKSVRDRSVPFKIDRKNKPPVSAALPKVHYYCCNGLPAIVEGNSGALDKRVTVIQFKVVEGVSFGATETLGDDMWAADGRNVLLAAMEGLEDLIDSDCQYFVAQSSQAHFAEHQAAYDQVESFKRAIETGDFKVPEEKLKEVKIFDALGQKWITASSLWAVYRMWFADDSASCSVSGAMGKKNFIAEFAKKRGSNRRDRVAGWKGAFACGALIEELLKQGVKIDAGIEEQGVEKQGVEEQGVENHAAEY